MIFRAQIFHLPLLFKHTTPIETSHTTKTMKVHGRSRLTKKQTAFETVCITLETSIGKIINLHKHIEVWMSFWFINGWTLELLHIQLPISAKFCFNNFVNLKTSTHPLYVCHSGGKWGKKIKVMKRHEKSGILALWRWWFLISLEFFYLHHPLLPCEREYWTASPKYRCWI